MEAVSNRSPADNPQPVPPTLAAQAEDNSSSSNRLRLVQSNIPLRPTAHDYLIRTTDEERERIRLELNCALLQFLDHERPVFLDGIGFLVPLRKKTRRIDVSFEQLLVRPEIQQEVIFEKCDDPDSYIPPSVTSDGHEPASRTSARAGSAKQVQLIELSDRVYSKLPLPLQAKWSESDFRRLLRGFFRFMRERLIEDGFSDEVRAVGTLYAFHNRQGASPADWFAGSDIILVPRRVKTIALGQPGSFARPVLRGPFEFFHALYGKPVAHRRIIMGSTITGTGQQGSVPKGSDFKSSGMKNSAASPRSLEIQVFSSLSTPEDLQSDSDLDGTRGLLLTYCADFFCASSLTRQSGDSAAQRGFALMVQTIVRPQFSPAGELGSERVDRAAPASAQECGIPEWPVDLIAAALESIAKCNTSGGRCDPIASPIVFDMPFSVQGSCTKLKSAVTCQFSRSTLTHLSDLGPFRFVNILGISQDERRLCEKRGREHLIYLLRKRSSDQITIPQRGSIFQRSRIAICL